MRLVRTLDGVARYALIRLDKMSHWERDSLVRSIERIKHFRVLVPGPAIEFSHAGGEEECFVIKLKDINAPAALLAYADECEKTDPEFAKDVREMAERAKNHPSRKIPDVNMTGLPEN